MRNQGMIVLGLVTGTLRGLDQLTLAAHLSLALEKKLLNEKQTQKIRETIAGLKFDKNKLASLIEGIF